MQGSLTNRMLERQAVTPEVGMGVTECMWSDRHAYTIVRVVNAKTIVVRRDKAVRTDKNGISESQTYSYEEDPTGTERTVTLRKNGRWVTKGESMNGTGWMIGSREEYEDPSF